MHSIFGCEHYKTKFFLPGNVSQLTAEVSLSKALPRQTPGPRDPRAGQHRLKESHQTERRHEDPGSRLARYLHAGQRVGDVGAEGEGGGGGEEGGRVGGGRQVGEVDALVNVVGRALEGEVAGQDGEGGEEEVPREE